MEKWRELFVEVRTLNKSEFNKFREAFKHLTDEHDKIDNRVIERLRGQPWKNINDER